MDTRDTAELLAELKDIHLPPAPDTPETWPMIVSVVVCTLFIVAWLWRRHRNTHHWHTQALQPLKQLRQLPANVAAPETARLLKRIALTHDNHRQVRQLHGDSWLRYLDRFFNTDFFSRGNGRVFGNALYQPDIQIDAGVYDELQRLIRQRSRES